MSTRPGRTAPSRTAPQGAARILLPPLLFAALSLTGLVLGLTGDGWRDAVAVALLAVPVASFVRCHWRSKPPS